MLMKEFKKNRTLEIELSVFSDEFSKFEET